MITVASSMTPVDRMALRSEVLAGGRLHRSRGVRKSWHGEDVKARFGRVGRYATCNAGHFLFEQGESAECPCGAELGHSSRSAIVVEHVFSTAAWQPPQRSGGRALAASVEDHVLLDQAGEPELNLPALGGVAGLVARGYAVGQLLTINAGVAGFGFAICTACGYADAETSLAPANTGQQLPPRVRRAPNTDHRGPADHPAGGDELGRASRGDTRARAAAGRVGLARSGPTRARGGR